MNIFLNGKKTELAESLLLADALKTWSHEDQTIAVAINETFIPRHQYANTILTENMRIEIVAPMEGG